MPLYFGYEYTDGSPVFFLHSAREGNKLDLIRACPAVCVELECGVGLILGGGFPFFSDGKGW